MVVEKFTDLLERQNFGIRGENIFLGKSTDLVAHDVILLSEETATDQIYVFNNVAQEGISWITIRVSWGDSYLTSQNKALEIYDFLRRYVPKKDFISLEPRSPVFTTKIRHGAQFQFNILVKTRYLVDTEPETT